MRFSRNLCCLICVLILLFMTSCTKNTSSNVEVIYEEYESSINSDSTSDETVISSQVVSTDSITITEPQYKPDFQKLDIWIMFARKIYRVMIRYIQLTI